MYAVKKRVVPIFLALLMMLGATSVGGLGLVAGAEVYNGTCGPTLSSGDVSWTIDTVTGIMTLTGTGRTKDYSGSSGRPYDSYKNYVTTIIIGEGITRLGDYAIKGFANLQSVVIPSTMTEFGYEAFKNCTNLTITVPYNVDTFESNCLLGVKQINCYYNTDAEEYCQDEELSFELLYGGSASSNSMVSWLFDDETGKLTFFGSGAMSNYASGAAVPWAAFVNQITSLEVTAGVTNVGNFALADTTLLASVRLASSVTTIGSNSFSGCTALGEVFIPGTVTAIGTNAFSGDGSLTILCEKGSAALTYAVNNSIPYIIIGNCGLSVTWRYNPSAKTLQISGSGEMTDYTGGTAPWFDYAGNIETIVVDETVSGIGDYSFDGLAFAKTISIPLSVATIGTNVFTGCDSLEAIGVDLLNTSFYSSDGALYDASGILICYPAAKQGETFIMPDFVTGTAANAFDGANNLLSIEIGKNVVSIDSDSFNRCENIESFTVNSMNESFAAVDGVLFTIDMATLAAYPVAKSASFYVIPAGVTAISENAFNGNPNINDIIIPAEVTTIAVGAFVDCTNICICCYPDSAAHQYAVGNLINFKLITDEAILITGEPKYNSVLTADISSYTDVEAYFTWMINGVDIGGETTGTYTAKASDIGQKISVKAYLVSETAVTFVTGEGVTILKADRTISAPVFSETTRTGVTVGDVTVSDGSDDGTICFGWSTTDNADSVSNWQTSNVFTGFNHTDVYYFFAKIIDGTNYIDAVSESTQKTFPYETITGTIAIMKGGTGVATAAYGDTLTVDFSGVLPADAEVDYAWYRDGVKISGDSTYQLVAADIGASIYVAVTGKTDFDGTLTSNTVTVTKADNTAAPLYPQAQGITTGSIILVPHDGYEYKIGEGLWTTNNEFNGLHANTEYTFYQRIAETSTHFASATSEAFSISTLKITLTGNVAYSGTPEYAETMTAVLSGIPEGATFDVEWICDGAAVSTGNTLYLSEELIGKEIFIRCTATGDYTGTLESTPFTVTKASVLLSFDIGAIDDVTYSGTAFTPAVTVTFKTNTVDADDYSVAYLNNRNAGPASVTVTAAEDSNFAGSKTVYFTINRRSISEASVSQIASVYHTGSAITSRPVISYAGGTLAENTDYELVFTNNINIGTAVVHISGIGNFTGSAQTTFTIKAVPVSTISVTSAVSLKYKEHTTLTATVAPSNATNGTVRWSSSNPSVATVDADSGYVNAVGTGKAVITATATDGSGTEASCNVTVKYTWWQWIIVIILFGWVWY